MGFIGRFALSVMMAMLFTVPAAWACPLGYDFGDAPESYGVAKHEITGLYLGDIVDNEWSNQPSVGADGDDLDDLSDEDGVVISGPLTAGETVSVTVRASTSGRLDAWIDFEGDGSFDPEDQIFASLALDSGDNSGSGFSFVVPSILTLEDTTYARFRVSVCGGLAPTGFAWTGEVEDYLVDVNQVPVPSALLLLGSGLIGLVGVRRSMSKG